MRGDLPVKKPAGKTLDTTKTAKAPSKPKADKPPRKKPKKLPLPVRFYGS